jgi:hypothetical protein
MNSFDIQPDPNQTCNVQIAMNNKQKINSSLSTFKDSYKIPVEGSLGLLALGARGIIEWRKVRDASRKKGKPGNTNTK